MIASKSQTLKEFVENSYKIEAAIDIYRGSPCNESVLLNALNSGSEGSTNIGIDQQVDHNDDRYNPATYNGEY